MHAQAVSDTSVETGFAVPAIFIRPGTPGPQHALSLSPRSAAIARRAGLAVSYLELCCFAGRIFGRSRNQFAKNLR
jgi:hypothetical protein